MKYKVVERVLKERRDLDPYYVITLQGDYFQPVGNVSVEELTIVRSVSEGKAFVVGSDVYLSSPADGDES